MSNGLDIHRSDAGLASTSDSDQPPSPALKRQLSLPLLSLNGIGVTIGTGIYVLVGKVAVGTGMHAPLSFLVAAILVGFTAFSYAELGGGVPKSAGEAMFVHAAFGSSALATAIGFLVMTTGIISSGAVVIGFVGYLHEVMASPSTITIIGAGMTKGADVVAVLPEVVSPAAWNHGAAIPSGAVLAFFVFVGFEDIVNVAEESKDPVRTVPCATIITLVVSSGLYFLVALIAAALVPLDRLGGGDAPLALVFEEVTGRSAALISLIAIFAVLNGVMIQLIMSSRILYGIAREGWIPRIFAKVHPTTRTPTLATSVDATVVILLALTVPIVRLAEMTSYLVLTGFTVVNLAFIRIKLRDPAPAPERFSVGLWVPVTGAVPSLGILIFDLLLG